MLVTGQRKRGEIDQLNVLAASHLAMQRAVAGLTTTPDTILVDGNKTPGFGLPTIAIVKGDVASRISAHPLWPR
ncbi:MAG: hypothetical protein CM15mP120_22470 [Pseudomonadota bacterium]|nr:MAG: hypothetical protein CM15mP120_22470 [Pseudomonadota bacterium]